MTQEESVDIPGLKGRTGPFSRSYHRHHQPGPALVG